MNFITKTCVTLALSASVTGAAHAAIITYHQDNSGFQSALSDIQVEDFEDPTLLGGLTIGGSGNFANGILYRVLQPTFATTFTFADPTFGFGGMIRGEGSDKLSIALTFMDGTQELLGIYNIDPTKRFFGFTSDLGIKSITLRSGTSGSLQYYMDSLTFGAAAVAPVPEPASWAMMILGLGVVGGALRRQRVARVSFA